MEEIKDPNDGILAVSVRRTSFGELVQIQQGGMDDYTDTVIITLDQARKLIEVLSKMVGT